MSLDADVVPAVAETLAVEMDAHRPAGVFISYASEDHDIAQALHQTLQSLGETVYDRIKVFLNSKSLSGGDEIRDDIRAFLYKSDFLIVVYTGVFKRSHGYAGFEVGFFDALIQEEIKKYGRATRRIISVYLDEPPLVLESILGICMNVDFRDLGGNRADYVQKSIQSPDSPDALARLFSQIAGRAEERFPPQLQDADTQDRNRQRRKKLIAEDIIPNLKGKLFDCLSTRVTRRSVEQKLVEVELQKAAPDQTYISIPDDAKLTQHSGAFEIFGAPVQSNSLSWGEFKSEVRSRDVLGGSSILLAMEQALVSAISPSIRVDNEQIIKSLTTDKIYRILITRQIDFFNGRKLINMYFVEKLAQSSLGNDNTSVILGFINTAAKYRFIFIEEESPLSVKSFYLEPVPANVKSKVRQLMRELMLIEDEARHLKLDQAAAISIYFGSGDDLKTVKQLQARWFTARQGLVASAEKILGTDPASVDFGVANEEWLATLRSFRDTSDEINSTVTMRALENLKKSFACTKTHATAPSAPPGA